MGALGIFLSRFSPPFFFPGEKGSAGRALGFWTLALPGRSRVCIRGLSIARAALRFIHQRGK